MGLGKSIQTLGLILLAPPSGLEYKVPDTDVAASAKLPAGPTKRCTLIVCPVSVLSNWTDQVNQFWIEAARTMLLTVDQKVPLNISNIFIAKYVTSNQGI